MSWVKNTFTSSIGRKVTMSITGLFLVSFLIVHLIGNFQLFYADSGKAFNAYTYFMTNSPIIRVAELILVAGFVLHIVQSALLTKDNKKARPVEYAYKKKAPGVNIFSKYMGASGTVVLIFLVVHLQNFWYRFKFGAPDQIVYTPDGPQVVTQAELAQMGGTYQAYGNMYDIVVRTFKEEWWISILYIVAIILLGFHLNHGFQSAFRTLGLQHKKYTPAVEALGVAISVLIPLGFITFPIYFMFFA